MNDNSSYIELIYLIIDGEASEVERQTLFSALKENPDLQIEFQNAIMLNQASNAYALSEDVPRNLTNNLFSKAGLTYSGVSASTQAVQNNTKSGFWVNAGQYATSKYGFGVIGLIIGGLFALFLFDNIYNISIPSIPEKVEITLAESTQSSMNEDSNKDIGVNNSKELGKQHKTKKTKLLTSNYEAEDDIIQSLDKNKESTQENLEYSNISIFQKAESPDFHINRNIITKDIHAKKNLMNYSSLSGIKSNTRDERFFLEMNSSSFWNLPKETIYPEEIAKLYNMNLFLYYKLSNSISLGLGARQETFYVRYNTIDEFSRKFIYEQQPNLTNIELSIRYHPFDMNILDPYVQFNTGGSYYGYTLRAGIGSEIKVYDNIAFTLFLEYATLRYKHKNFWNDASKIGINYGINCKF